MPTVGIRELRDRLSEYLRRAAVGERVIVTDRGRPVAIISAPDTTDEVVRATAMVRDGFAQWGGGKPKGSSRSLRVKGRPLSETVLEDRR